MLRRVLLVIAVLLIALIINAFAFPYPNKNVPGGFRPTYGFSYSFENAAWYGLDSKQAYIDLLECCNFSWVRVPFYWDPSTRSARSGQMDLGNIDDVEFAIEEARKRNIKVIVALGAKTPYYPEYHLPQSIKDKIAYGETITSNHPIASEILEIDRKLVQRLSRYENISHWQVENEPFLANINNWKVHESLVKAEVDAIRATDPASRPIILSHVGPSAFDRGWKILAKIMEPGDVLGVNAYFETQGVNLLSFKLFSNQVDIPWPRGFVWPVQSWIFFSPNYEGLRKELAKAGKELWIMEMQADPYIRSLDDARKADFDFNAADVKKADNYLKQSRIKTIGLWGAPFWVYRQSIGDSSWLEAVKEITR